MEISITDFVCLPAFTYFGVVVNVAVARQAAPKLISESSDQTPELFTQIRTFPWGLKGFYKTYGGQEEFGAHVLHTEDPHGYRGHQKPVQK